MRLWSKFVDEGLHDGVTEFSFSAMFRERMTAMSAGDAREALRATSAIRAAPTASNPPTSTACSRRSCCTRSRPMSARSTIWSETLAENGGPWVLGGSPTLADINLMPYAARLDYLGLLGAWIDGRPARARLVGGGERMAELQARACAT